MHEKAFAALDAINRGALASLPDHESWLKALQTISWARPTGCGAALTPMGQQALADMKRTRRLVS